VACPCVGPGLLSAAKRTVTKGGAVNRVLLSMCGAVAGLSIGLDSGAHASRDNRPPTTLRQLANLRRVKIGAAASEKPLATDSAYAKLLVREFDMLTPEDEMEFDATQPKPGAFHFEKADQLVGLAQRHNMGVRGHALVWEPCIPNWVKSRRRNPQELANILRQQIRTEVTHFSTRFPGRVGCWDVVNEAVAEDGSLKTSCFSPISPHADGYIEKAFRWAHEADPTAQLYYNEFGAEDMGRKADGVYRLLSNLRARGVPVHGVGLQMHFSPGDTPDIVALASNLRRLAQLGLKIHITEFDYRLVDRPVKRGDLVEQAGVYRRMLRTCLAEPACEAFVLWGFTDKYSWIPEFAPGFGRALIFDEQYRPKPAHGAIIEELSRPRPAVQ
jgi:endo-1,4-beta-xylanase